MSTGLAPISQEFEAQLPQSAAAGSNDSVIICKAPWAGTLTAASYIPDTAITGANTNTRKIAIVNKGQAGAGTTEMAAKQYNAAVDEVAFDEGTLTLSATPANLVVATGDVIACASTAVGTGIADPGGTVFITLTRS